MKFKYLFLMLILCVGFVSATSCYQESSNVSNQAGTDTLSCGLIYSGSPIVGYGNDGGFLFENYTIRSSVNSAIITIGMMNQTTGYLSIENFTVPSDCLAGSKLQLRYFSKSHGNSDSSISCFNYSSANWFDFYFTSIGALGGGFAYQPYPYAIIDGNFSTSGCYQGGNWRNDCKDTFWTDVYYAGVYEAGVWWNISGCYQESVDIPNQGVPFGNPDGSCSLNYGGSYFHLNDTTFEQLYITYIKPPYAIGGTWIAKVQNETMLYLPIPSDCWNANSSSVSFQVNSHHGWYSYSGDFVELTCANAPFTLPRYNQPFSNILYSVGGTGRTDNGDYFNTGWNGVVVDGNWSTFDFMFDVGFGGTNRGVWASAPNDWGFLNNTKYSFVYEEAMNWNICQPSWIHSNSVCNSVNYTILYTDSNWCGTTVNLPVDNGTTVPCIACSPNWVESYTPATCTLGYKVKSYSDYNYCGVGTNLPFDNNTISSCNIFSSITADHTVKLWDNFTILAYAPVGTLVNVSLQYPNASTFSSSTSWNGVAFVSQSFNAYPSGNYTMSAFAGNQSISGNLVVTDFEAVIPTQFNAIVSAGSNFTFLLEIFTDSNYSLNHSISCSVPVGFSCIVPSDIMVLGNANATLIVTSNVSLADALYYGNLTVTRLIDGRTFSASLPLGISTAFGVAEIDNPSTFSQIMYSNEIKYKNYTITNVGNYNLTDCYVEVDGSFAGQSFVVGSNNFSIAPNESGIVSVAYVMPSSGIYTGYFNVFCVASVGGFINGLSNPQLQQLFVIPYIAPPIPIPNGGGGASVPYISLSNATTSQVFSLLNSGGIAGGYVTYTYALNTFSKTFIVKSNTADTLNLRVTCRGDFCQYVKFSRDSFSLAGFGTDYFTATVSVPSSVTLNGVYSYEVVLTDGSGRSTSLINSIHISSLSSWYSKFALITKEGDKGFWFSVGGFNVPKLLLYLLIVLIADGLTVLLMPKNKFYKKNIVLILTFTSLIVFGLSALLF